ncbi:hypothetical protein ACFL6H_08395 [Candidatus Latescibacterota bacterium]
MVISCVLAGFLLLECYMKVPIGDSSGLGTGGRYVMFGKASARSDRT